MFNKKTRRLTAALLAVVMAFSGSVAALALSGTGEGYSAFSHIVDKALGYAHDGLFAVLGVLTRKHERIPTADEFFAENPNYTYRGTQGKVSGDGWSGGFSSKSIIPVSWRRNAAGEADPEGYNLDKAHPTGGYQTKVSKLFSDQKLSMLILSNGSDSNGNGVDDLIIFASFDGVGATAVTTVAMRNQIDKALKKFGVTRDDIISCNISATHCHAGLDTQGMYILQVFKNRLNPTNNYNYSLDKDMLDTMCEQAYAAAQEAYSKMEQGKLSFFQTDKVEGASDKLNSGVKTVNKFSCFLFEGRNEKTFITNIGAHPVSIGAWDHNEQLCCDYPRMMSMAMEDAGYHLVFTQSAQAAISSPFLEKNDEASEWASKYVLSRDEWVERFGEKYTDKFFEEDRFKGNYENAYMLAHYVIDASANAAELAPDVRIKNQLSLLKLDYGVMYWGSISGLLGENIVRVKGGSETGFGILAETDYIEIDDIVILTGPGELSPSMIFGSDENYTGTAFWNGAQSWTGEEWKYDSVEKTVRDAFNDPDKTLVFMGITNDEIAYIYPDNCCTQSILGAFMFYKEKAEDMGNCTLMFSSAQNGSEIVKAYEKLIEEAV